MNSRRDISAASPGGPSWRAVLSCGKSKGRTDVDLSADFALLELRILHSTNSEYGMSFLAVKETILTGCAAV